MRLPAPPRLAAAQPRRPGLPLPPRATPGEAADAAYGWAPTPSPPPPPLTSTSGARLLDLPITSIRRPLAKSRPNDAAKVAALAASIAEAGLREPIDILECPDGVFWGFSGCHRYEAHQALGREAIACRVRRVSPGTLRMHLA